MAIALVSHTSVVGLSTTTSGSIDTTGATFLVAHGSYLASAGITVSDSKGNTWVPLTATTVVGSGSSQLFYVANPTVGTGHTFTFTGTGCSCALEVASFSGVTTTSPFDTQTGNQGIATSLNLSIGSPAAGSNVFVTGLHLESLATVSINSGFTIIEDNPFSAIVGNFGGALAYKVSATSESVTWTPSITTSMAGRMADFMPAVVATTVQPIVFVVT